MLSVNKNWRKRGIGTLQTPRVILMFSLLPRVSATELVQRSIDQMKRDGVQEVLFLC